MTLEEITIAIRASGYPDDLTDTEIMGAIDRATRDLKDFYPLETYGVFETVSGQQVYDLFNETVVSATRQGALTPGNRVLAVYGEDCSSGTSVDLFGLWPWLATTDFTGSSLFNLHTPGDWKRWDTNIASARERFSTLRFEHTTNLKGSPIRLFPTPCEVRDVLVIYTKDRDDETLREESPSNFLMWVEANCCFILARKFSLAAGTKIGDSADQGKTMAYWQDEGKRLLEDAQAGFRDLKVSDIPLVARDY